MKIKTKKTMTLPQLIEWGFENDVTRAIFADDIVKAKRIRFESGILVSIHGEMNKEDTFTVEVEEEITEDTWFPQLVTRTVKGHYSLWKKGSISSFKHITFNDIDAIYIPNDDLTMTLIWRDGRLVE